MTDHQKYFETFRDLFLQPGWHQLMTEIEADISGLNQLAPVNTLEELHFRKGQLATLTAMLNLEGSLKAAEAQLEESTDAGLE